MVAAACSSGASSTPTTHAPTFRGSPVMIGQIVPLTGPGLQLTQLGQAMTAAVAYYNSTGGLQGHKLVLDECDSQGTLPAETQCAQKLVNDHVVAEVGGAHPFNAGGDLAVFAAAGTPLVGLSVGAVPEYSSKIVYSIDPGQILMLAGMIVALIRHGCKNPSLVTIDQSGVAQIPTLINPIAEKAGGMLKNLVLVPSASVDYSPYVTAASANGSCGAAIALASNQANAYVHAYTSLGATFKLSFSSGTYSTMDLKKLSSTAMARTVYTYGVPFGDDPSVPGMANVEKILKGGGSDITLASANGQAISAVLGMHAFMVAAGGISGAITPSSVTAAMKSATNINMWGITPPWSPGKIIHVSGPFGSVFSNVSNPDEWDESWNGSHGTNIGTYNILADIPGSGVTATSN